MLDSIDHVFADTTIKSDFLLDKAECFITVFDKWGGTQHVKLTRNDILKMAKATGGSKWNANNV